MPGAPLSAESCVPVFLVCFPLLSRNCLNSFFPPEPLKSHECGFHPPFQPENGFHHKTSWWGGNVCGFQSKAGLVVEGGMIEEGGKGRSSRTG